MRANAQKTHNDTTSKTRPRTRIIHLRFDTSPTEQLIYNALKACTDHCQRKRVSEEAHFLIAIALCGREKLTNQIDFEALQKRVANGFDVFSAHPRETSGPPKLRLVLKESKAEG